MHKFKKGDKARVKSGATGAIANYVGQIVTVCGDPTLALFGVQVPGGGVHPVFASELEPIEETPQLQPGDMAYCTEPGHPCQGTLVAVRGPYTFDPDRIAVTALNGRQYHCDPKHLQPAPQPTQTQPAASATKPCPDCAHTSHPGRYVGFSGSPEPCQTCGGKMTVSDSPRVQNFWIGRPRNREDYAKADAAATRQLVADTVCRTWPLLPNVKIGAGEYIVLQHALGPIYGHVVYVRGDGNIIMHVEVDRTGKGWAGREIVAPGADVAHWNGVAP